MKLNVRIFAVMSLVTVAQCVMAVEEYADTVVAVGEVSVSAIKMNSDVRRQPMASTVINQGRIEREGIVNMRGASEMVPNFYIPDYGSRMTSTIYMRGLGARIDQPVVGMTVDNVPILNKDNYDFDLVDMERVEVLRGPQSTLYGRNTMGGQVNVYTLSPMRWQGVRAMVEYGSHNTLQASVGYYTKLTDRLAMSITGGYGQTDGEYTNLNNGEKCDHERHGGVRWKTQWRPGANVSVENTLGVQIVRQGGYPYELVKTGEINYNDTCFYRRTSVTDGLTVKWNVGGVQLSSITSFQYIDDNMTLDQDFRPEPYFTLTQARREWALTQDIIGRGSVGDYSWMGGVFGFYKDMDMDAPVAFKETGIEELIMKHRNDANPAYPIRWDEDEFVLGSNFKNPTYGVALYHQSSLKLGALTLTGGLRLDYERSELKYHSDCHTGYETLHVTADGIEHYRHDAVDIADGGDMAKDFVQLLPKVTAAYQLPTDDDWMVYGSVAKGYKAGGFNTQMFSDVLQQRLMGQMGIGMSYDVDDIVGYKPEKSWNYEVGTHYMSADGRVQGDVALFYIDCRDQQLTIFPDGTTTGRMMTNAGRSRSYGAEAALRLYPTDNLAVNLSYGYTNARFSEYDNGKEDFSGNRVPYAPAHTAYAGVTYRQPLATTWADEVVVDVNARGVGDMMWNEANTERQRFYVVPSASVGVEGGQYAASVWVDNFTSTKYNTFYFVSMSNAFLQRGKGCRVGVTLRLKFEIE